MIVQCRNCQGAASKGLMRSLKEFIRIHKPDVIGLLEPKVSGIHTDNICKHVGFEEWARVESVRYSGGI